MGIKSQEDYYLKTLVHTVTMQKNQGTSMMPQVQLATTDHLQLYQI